MSKEFTEKSIFQGFYDGDASRWASRWQYWVFEEYIADFLFNKSRALLNTDDGIFINTHQQGFRDALFHEIFHAFESRNNWSASSFYAAGFAEYFAGVFGAAKPYNLKMEIFAQYEEQYNAAKTLVEQAVLQCNTPLNDPESTTRTKKRKTGTRHGFWRRTKQ